MKNAILILLIAIICVLFYFIIIGRFCHCSSITCPSNNVLRSQFG